MVLETHMNLRVTEPDFPKKVFCPKNKDRDFFNLLKNLILIFTEFVL